MMGIAYLGIGSPPDPGAAGVGVWAAMAAESAWVKILVSIRDAGSCMHNGASYSDTAS